MSLVGSELNLVLDFDGLEGKDETVNAGDGAEQLKSPTPSTPAIAMDEDDPHEVHTPVSGIESFFFGGNVSTDRISARALAQELHQRHRPLLSVSSQDDYATARSDEVSDYFTLTEKENDDEFPSTASIDKATSRELHFESKEDLEEPETTTMSTKTKVTKTTSAPTVAPVPAAASNADAPMNVDPAEKVYDTVKGVWGWGKGVFIFKPFMGIAEAVAGKVVTTAGSSLEQVDQVLLSKLHGLDDGILNPTISFVVKTVIGASNKTKDMFTPIILILLKPIDFMIKSKPETASKPAPEVTPYVEPMN